VHGEYRPAGVVANGRDIAVGIRDGDTGKIVQGSLNMGMTGVLDGVSGGMTGGAMKSAGKSLAK
jgi:hypothetical protein